MVWVIGMDALSAFGNPELVLRQESSSTEARAVGQACRMLDIEGRLCGIEALQEHEQGLRSGTVMPVGSVEYVRAAMHIGAVAEPVGLSYPDCLHWLMKRAWRRCTAREVMGGEFVKPVVTKRFTGFVLPVEGGSSGLDDHDQEQYEAFKRLQGSEPVFACERVQWLCEWRIYVVGGLEMGRARYDPFGEDDAPTPDEREMARALESMRAWLGDQATYSLDVGVLSDGRTALVEGNDAFALGLYGGSLSARQYLQMLWVRWQQIALRDRGPATA